MSKRHFRSGSDPHRKLYMYCAACDDIGGSCGHPRVRLGGYFRPPRANRKKRRTEWRRKIVARLRRLMFPEGPKLTKKPPRRRGGKIMPKWL